MIDMKRSVEKAESALLAPEMQDEYPYGLRIHLGNDELAKLNMAELPAIGVEMTLTAKVRVVEVSQSDSVNGEPHRRVEMQIEQMNLSTNKSAEQAMYPSMLA